MGDFSVGTFYTSSSSIIKTCLVSRFLVGWYGTSLKSALVRLSLHFPTSSSLAQPDAHAAGRHESTRAKPCAFHTGLPMAAAKSNDAATAAAATAKAKEKQAKRDARKIENGTAKPRKVQEEGDGGGRGGAWPFLPSHFRGCSFVFHSATVYPGMRACMGKLVHHERTVRGQLYTTLGGGGGNKASANKTKKAAAAAPEVVGKARQKAALVDWFRRRLAEDVQGARGEILKSKARSLKLFSAPFRFRCQRSPHLRS